MKNDNLSSTLPGSDTCTLSVDLQKVFQIPKLTHSNMYYYWQLSVYNFGIHIQDTSDAVMCLWHEGESSRGRNQMASCLLRAINEDLITSKKKLVLWSDNCCGQLKNRMMLFLYLYLIAIGMFDKIEHKFLMVGHSFGSADRDFALIEQRWKVASKNQVMGHLLQPLKKPGYLGHSGLSTWEENSLTLTQQLL